MGFMTPIVDRFLASLIMWLATSGPILCVSPTSKSSVAIVASSVDETATSNSSNLPEKKPAQKPAIGKVPEIEESDPALLQVLREWETASSKVQRLDCSFRRFVYDDLFEIDKRAEGELAIESSTKAKYVIRPGAIRKKETSQKKNSRGDAFKVITDVPERWHWTGAKVIRINDKSRTYESVSLSLETQVVEESKPSFWTLLHDSYSAAFGEFWFARPFILGMPADELLRKFKITLVKQTETEVWLDFEPRQTSDAINYKNARMILDRTLMVPQALQMVDPSGNKVTVHTFSNVRINGPIPESDDLGEPNLEGFRLTRNERPAASKSAETAK